MSARRIYAVLELRFSECQTVTLSASWFTRAGEGIYFLIAGLQIFLNTFSRENERETFHVALFLSCPVSCVLLKYSLPARERAATDGGYRVVEQIPYSLSSLRLTSSEETFPRFQP